MTIKVWQSGQKMWQFMECVTLLDENAWRAWFVPAHRRIYHGTHLPRDTWPGATFFFWHILHVAQLARSTQWHYVHLSSECVAFLISIRLMFFIALKIAELWNRRIVGSWRSNYMRGILLFTKQLDEGVMWFDLRFVIQWLPSGNHAFRPDPVCTQRGNERGGGGRGGGSGVLRVILNWPPWSLKTTNQPPVPLQIKKSQ